jgi:hypothetical protein
VVHRLLPAPLESAAGSLLLATCTNSWSLRLSAPAACSLTFTRQQSESHTEQHGTTDHPSVEFTTSGSTSTHTGPYSATGPFCSAFTVVYCSVSPLSSPAGQQLLQHASTQWWQVGYTPVFRGVKPRSIQTLNRAPSLNCSLNLTTNTANQHPARRGMPRSWQVAPLMVRPSTHLMDIQRHHLHPFLASNIPAATACMHSGLGPLLCWLLQVP